MSLSLYSAFVPRCQQILGGMAGLIDKAEAHLEEHGLEDAHFIEARLAETMWPLPWHVRSCWMHSSYAIGQLPSGEFTPDFTELPTDWDAMRAMVADAQSGLASVTSEQLDAVADTTVAFVLGGKRRMEFTGQDMLLGFNQPNFYFHATTFYDILRMQGLPIGKRDFLGQVPVKG